MATTLIIGSLAYRLVKGRLGSPEGEILDNLGWLGRAAAGDLAPEGDCMLSPYALGMGLAEVALATGTQLPEFGECTVALTPLWREAYPNQDVPALTVARDGRPTASAEGSHLRVVIAWAGATGQWDLRFHGLALAAVSAVNL